jgi:ABC-type polysaccharide/polyol phosphate export permease
VTSITMDRQAAAGEVALREAPPVLVLEPTRGTGRLDFRELWHYRDLLYFLTWREISVRYKQTVLGFAWAVLQPLLTMLVFTVFLGRLAKIPSDGIPYPVFTYLGLLPWMYFANALTRSSMSLVSNASLVSKVYFPRVLIPLSGTLSALVDFLVAFAILGVLMAWYRIVPAPEALLLIPLSALTALAALGVGMWLAALNVQYRDVQHAIPFLVQVWWCIPRVWCRRSGAFSSRSTRSPESSRRTARPCWAVRSIGCCSACRRSWCSPCWASVGGDSGGWNVSSRISCDVHDSDHRGA